MRALLGQIAESHRAQLVATAVLSGLAVGGLILAFQAVAHREKVSELKRSIPDAAADGSTTTSSVGQAPQPAPDREDARNQALASRARAGDFDEELVREQLARNRVFLGEDGVQRLRDAFVVVVGCGGVGSHCAAALARSGVSRLRLVDFDQVSLSSLNRHAVATLADVGTSKVDCLRRRLIAVAPWVHFDLRQEQFDASAARHLLEPWSGHARHDARCPDFVVDAIDNLTTKVALLRFCHAEGLPVVSSMGAGCKSDPTRVMVGDIGASIEDGLSRATRRQLKLFGVTSGIPVVYSTERPGDGKATLLPIPDHQLEQGNIDDLAILPNFRVRILPVLGTMPAIFGLTLANHVILTVSGYPHHYLPNKYSEKVYESVLGNLLGSEERLARLLAPDLPTGAPLGLRLPITTGEVAFLVDEIYRCRSVVSGLTARLTLVRWRCPTVSVMTVTGEGASVQRSSNARLADLVCMTRAEALRHEKEVFAAKKSPQDLYDAGTIERVLERMAEAARYEGF